MPTNRKASLKKDEKELSINLEQFNKADSKGLPEPTSLAIKNKVSDKSNSSFLFILTDLIKSLTEKNKKTAEEKNSETIKNNTSKGEKNLKLIKPNLSNKNKVNGKEITKNNNKHNKNNLKSKETLNE